MKNMFATRTTVDSESSSQIKIGKFTIFKDKVVGQGAFSSVYLAKDESNRLYATKVLSKHNKVHYAIAKMEVKMLSSINHSNVPRYISSFQSNNNFYIIMNYVEGRTLREHISRWKKNQTKRPILPQLLQIVVSIIDTIKYLYVEHRIIHRDLKPDNIIYSNKGQIMLIDFGFACKVNKTENLLRSKELEFVGTMQYMSPELLKREKFDGEKEDIWSLGILIYQILFYGSYPWTGNNETNLYNQIIKNQLEFPKDTQIPILVKQLIIKCLKQSPSKRLNWGEVFQYGQLIKTKYLERENKSQQEIQCQCSLFSFRNNKMK